MTWNLKPSTNEARRPKIELACPELDCILAQTRTPTRLMEEHYGGTRN